MGAQRFAVLLCAEDSEYVRKKYGGYYEVFVNLLREDGETWDLYRVVAGEYPKEEEISLYDGFVISGSCNDAHGNDVWVCKLLNFLQVLHSMEKKILGICFGHQILCRAIGGKTGRAAAGWDLGMTTIDISSKLSSSIDIPSTLSVIECHRDEVIELPPLAKAVATSDQTRVEMFVCGQHIMGIQGHPEYTGDVLHNLLDRLLQRKFITEPQAEAARASIEASEASREAWKKMCRGFLKGQLVLSDC